MKEIRSPFYIESVSYRSFRELCDSCRDQSKIGMSFGRPGVGKSEASLRYSNWSLVEANLAVRTGVPISPENLLACETLYYKPSITVSPQRLKSELAVAKNRFHDAKMRAVNWTSVTDWATASQKQQVSLIIVDEAHRLKYAAFEELRDLQERWNVGIVLIGDPGMERSLVRMFHFADRVRYVEKFNPFSMMDVVQYTHKQAELLGVAMPEDDVYQLLGAYSRGNPRILGHLFALIEKLLKINSDIVQEITREVVDTAREMMLLGLGGKAVSIELPSDGIAALASAG
jgi:DNA transposition AAA+ family ATPase